MKIAIDGPAGSGKSTIARLVAGRLGFNYIDTGAMYRALAWKAIHLCIPFTDIEALGRMLDETCFSFFNGKMCLDRKVLSSEIRSPELSRLASDISKLKIIRDYLTAEQRNLSNESSVVMEGRDIGTVVLPEAEFKFFLTASPEERARRRVLQLTEMGKSCNYDDVLRDILFRDRNDSTRELAPLKPADDAIIIDTTDMTIDEITGLIVRRVT